MIPGLGAALNELEAEEQQLPVYVVAARYEVAKRWAHGRGISLTRLRFIDELDRMQGVARGTEVVLLPGYGDNRAWAAISRMLHERGMTTRQAGLR